MQKVKLNNGVEMPIPGGKTSLFFHHRAPALVKWLGEFKAII